MSSPVANTKAPDPSAAIIRDQEELAGKKALMKGMKSNSIFNSVSMVAAFIAGPIIAKGIGEGLVTAGLTSGGMAVVATIGIGILIGAVAVAASYLSSRKWQSSSIDANVFNAHETGKSVAEGLVKELEAKNLCITNKPEAPHHCRSDGKSWEEYVASRPKVANEEQFRIQA